MPQPRSQAAGGALVPFLADEAPLGDLGYPWAGALLEPATKPIDARATLAPPAREGPPVPDHGVLVGADG